MDSVDVWWCVISSYLKSVYDIENTNDYSISCNEEHRNVKNLGIYLSGDLYLLRTVNRTIKKSIDKYTKYNYSKNQKKHILNISNLI